MKQPKPKTKPKNENNKKKIKAPRKKLSRAELLAFLKKQSVDTLITIIGSAIYSFGFHTLAFPNKITPGGVTGVASLIAHATELNPGTLYMLFNIPIVILGFIFLRTSMMIKTLISVGVITLCTDVLFVNFPTFEDNVMLAAIFVGVCFGTGLGLVYSRDATSGGVDIINRIIHKKLPHISLGTITLAADAIVVAASMAVFGAVEYGLYAIIGIFIEVQVIDMLVYGRLEGKLLLIFTDDFEPLSKELLKAGVGVTLLSGEGAYTGAGKKILCCAVHKHRYVRVKRMVAQIDPSAFIVISNASEVLGAGFQANTNHT